MDRLHKLLERVPIKLLLLEEEEVSFKPAPNRWSKKEILGHLLDSAMNNHLRFFQLAGATEPLHVLRYDQDRWVDVHRYRDASWTVLVEDWKALNCRILRLLVHLSSTDFQKPVILPDGEKKNGAFLINDYTDHQMHHLRQILPTL